MRSKNLMKNSIVNSISLGLTILFSFIIRKVLLYYLGVEILGVNSVIVETLGTLSLCEMGLQTAVIYRLYQPIADREYERVAALFSFLKKAYCIIGIVVLGIGFMLVPFLPRIVNTTLNMRYVYAIYFLRLGAVSLSFFLSYYRVLFVVHEKQYECVKIDIVAQLIVSFLQIYALYKFQNYILYVVIEYLRIGFVYSIIIWKTKKNYAFVKGKHPISDGDKKNIFGDLKEIIFGNVAGYIYSSTDSMIISFFSGSIVVGFISNYKTITSAIRGTVSGVNNAIAPTWGNYLHEKKETNDRLNMFYTHTLCQFLICLVTLIPTLCLADNFIAIWIGEEYIISPVFLVLIIADIFIQNVHEPAAIVMRGEGMFREDKGISIFATITNLLVSVVFAQIWGAQGVLLGTVVASASFWVLRVYAVICGKWQEKKREYLRYFSKMFFYMFLFVVEYGLVYYVTSRVIISHLLLQFAVKGIISEIVIIFTTVLIFFKDSNFRFLCNIVLKTLRNKKRAMNEYEH